MKALIFSRAIRRSYCYFYGNRNFVRVHSSPLLAHILNQITQFIKSFRSSLILHPNYGKAFKVIPSVQVFDHNSAYNTSNSNATNNMHNSVH